MPPAKRQKLDWEDNDTNERLRSSLADEGNGRATSLDAPISPPSRKLAHKPAAEAKSTPATDTPTNRQSAIRFNSASEALTPKVVPSPVQLIRISDLNPLENVDTIDIRDILGDPLIKECWAFNYCFDVGWLLENFDEDVRDQVQVVLVHGSWRRESPTRVKIEEAVKRHKNVRAITAYMPDPYGTHHSKMFILIRHDDAAQ
jgi:tyrosyl-DNA phosphodiesterase 1